jgi:hypothetical protein
VIEEVAEAGRRLVRIEVPSDKRLMAPFNTDAMRALVGPWLGTQLTRYAMLPVERARLLLDLLTAQGHAFNYDGQYRRVAHAVLSAPQAAEPEPEEESDGPRMR